jgi:hypothetical protein
MRTEKSGSISCSMTDFYNSSVDSLGSATSVCVQDMT